ncbi:MAG: Holliday junction branch migration protein RuvA [Thermodesulfobacteriota bacterium]
MIGYLDGILFRRRPDGVLLLVSGVGYEVLLPRIVADQLTRHEEGDRLSLHIYHHQTERQPRPTLIGFLTEEEREFFELFLTVEDIGPSKAVQALCLPLAEIAAAIEAKDGKTLSRMKGVGKRTADKMVATLHGKVARFCAQAPAPEPVEEEADEDMVAQVLSVMVNQLGHGPAEAREMIGRAIRRNPGVKSAEELFDEVYRK